MRRKMSIGTDTGTLPPSGRRRRARRSGESSARRRCSPRPNYVKSQRSQIRRSIGGALDGTGNGATTQINGKTSQASRPRRSPSSIVAAVAPDSSPHARARRAAAAAAAAFVARGPSRGARRRRATSGISPRRAAAARGDRVGAGGAEAAMVSADPGFWKVRRGRSARSCAGSGVWRSGRGSWTANRGSWSQAIGDLSSCVRRSRRRIRNGRPHIQASVCARRPGLTASPRRSATRSGSGARAGQKLRTENDGTG